jgi:hypothetical protein
MGSLAYSCKEGNEIWKSQKRQETYWAAEPIHSCSIRRNYLGTIIEVVGLYMMFRALHAHCWICIWSLINFSLLTHYFSVWLMNTVFALWLKTAGAMCNGLWLQTSELCSRIELSGNKYNANSATLTFCLLIPFNMICNILEH